MYKSNLHYEQKEENGKHFFVLKSEIYDEKQLMLQDLSEVLLKVVGLEMGIVRTIQLEIEHEHCQHPIDHSIPIEDIKATLRYIQYKIKAYSDQCIFSSCSKEEMSRLQMEEWSLTNAIQHMEQIGKTKERMG